MNTIFTTSTRYFLAIFTLFTFCNLLHSQVYVPLPPEQVAVNRAAAIQRFKDQVNNKYNPFQRAQNWMEDSKAMNTPPPRPSLEQIQAFNNNPFPKIGVRSNLAPGWYPAPETFNSNRPIKAPIDYGQINGENINRNNIPQDVSKSNKTSCQSCDNCQAKECNINNAENIPATPKALPKKKVIAPKVTKKPVTPKALPIKLSEDFLDLDDGLNEILDMNLEPLGIVEISKAMELVSKDGASTTRSTITSMLNTYNKVTANKNINDLYSISIKISILEKVLEKLPAIRTNDQDTIGEYKGEIDDLGIKNKDIKENTPQIFEPFSVVPVEETKPETDFNPLSDWRPIGSPVK